MVVMVAKFHENAKIQGIIHSKRKNFLVCKLSPATALRKVHDNSV